jgi:hypothetical protein
MGELHVFSEEHADGLVALWFRAMRGRQPQPAPGLRQYFCDMLLNNPWANPDQPSYVYLEKGQVVGSLGVIPREMEFGGRKLRMGVGTQFMVDPEFRRGPAAIVMLKRWFSGAQDLCWTDGAADAVHPLWQACGGRNARLYSLQWMRFLRPFAMAHTILSRSGPAWRKSATGLVAPVADAVVTGLTGSLLRPPSVPVQAVSAEALFNCIQELGWRENLRPAYDLASFSWLMTEMEKAAPVRRVIVPGPDGAAAGWCIYWAKPNGGDAYLFQIGVRRRDLFPTVLSGLFSDAWEQGCGVVRGYSMPTYLTQLTEHKCLFRHPGSCVLVQSRDTDLVNAVQQGEAALTRLDGECWLRFSERTWG